MGSRDAMVQGRQKGAVAGLPWQRAMRWRSGRDILFHNMTHGHKRKRAESNRLWIDGQGAPRRRVCEMWGDALRAPARANLYHCLPGCLRVQEGDKEFSNRVTACDHKLALER